MDQRARLRAALLALRLGVFVVMAVWTLDKFVNPDHAARVYEGFYGLPGLGELAFQVLGGLEAALLLGFLFGVRKRFTYGMVLALHAVSTFASYEQYLEPFDHLLFFAAWPMLAACLALYLLRDQDTWLTL